MPTLRKYRVFISHAWHRSEEYHRVVRFLDEAPNFEWINLSVPEHDAFDPTSEDLMAAMNAQMRPANIFLILAGMYVSHSDWIDYEINFARRIGRPILGIQPRGNIVIPKAVQNNAREMVGWTGASIVGAIRRLALPDGV